MRQIILFASLLSIVSCGKKKEDKPAASSGSGTYPLVYDVTKLAIPSFTKSSLSFAPSRQITNFDAMIAGSVPSSSTNFGSSSDWTSVTASTSNSIGQFLTDAGLSGTVKSFWTVIAGVQSTIEEINKNATDSEGEIDKTKCTEIASTTNLVTPYWNTATGSIVSISDAGKYQCYLVGETNDAITAFGRHEIASAPSSCTDPYEYYVVMAYAADDTPTQSQDSSYGATQDSASSTRFYYHGCDKTLKIQLATLSKYSGGTEFSLRTEAEGNVGTQTFKMRSAWVDITSSGGGMMSSIVGAGRTFKVGDNNGLFLIGDLGANCPTSTTCQTPTGAYNYCVENTGSGTSTFAVASSSATCAAATSTASDYTGLTPITNTAASNLDGVPREIFVATKASMGL